jgi:putative transposase
MHIENEPKEYIVTDKGQFSCQYHIVFCTKYNRRIFTEKYSNILKEIFNEIAETDNINIIDMAILPDYVHLVITCPPDISVQKYITKFKNTSAKEILLKCPELKSRMPQIWTRKTFISTVGDVTNNSIYNYIETQRKEREECK